MHIDCAGQCEHLVARYWEYSCHLYAMVRAMIHLSSDGLI